MLSFFKQERGQLIGLQAFYVNDALACGDSPFSELTEEIWRRFKLKSHEHVNMRLSVVYIYRPDNVLNIQQSQYIYRRQHLTQTWYC